MNSANRPITSREYKLILNVDRFADRGRGARQLWAVLEFLIGKAGGAISKVQDATDERETRYLDTPGHDLHERGLSLRVRREAKKKRKVTLKLRAKDRYLAAAFDLRTEKAADPEWRFEEDILPPLASVLAHSVSFETRTTSSPTRSRGSSGSSPAWRLWTSRRRRRSAP
jgi:hypothetical protein